jgi:trehalose-6-phosphatase
MPGILEACSPLGGLGKASLGLLAGQPTSLPLYVGGGEADEDAFEAMNARNGITVHAGAPPRHGTAARFMVADTAEVIRLVHWIADARRRAG